MHPFVFFPTELKGTLNYSLLLSIVVFYASFILDYHFYVAIDLINRNESSVIFYQVS